MNYRQLSDNEYSYGAYRIIPIRESDMEPIRVWRNEQMDVLRQSRQLTEEDQRRYYSETVRESFEQPFPRIMLFSYLLEGHLIGYGGLTNIDWQNKRAEISYLLETARNNEANGQQYVSDFSGFLRLMKLVAFEHLAFNRVFTETYDIRPLHISVLENNGFVLEGRMRQHVHIQGKFMDSLIHGYLFEEYDHVQE